MRIVSHPEADEELFGTALWYEERQPGLGDDFPAFPGQRRQRDRRGLAVVPLPG